MDDNNKIDLLSRQLKEIQSTINGLQSLISNGDFAIHKELQDLRNEQNKISQKLDKLLKENEPVIDLRKGKGIKQYTDKEVYEIRKREGSISKAAKYIGCSTSAIQKRCRSYLFSDMNIGD